jgi:phage host-nuclease inhibitor protein Gam
MLCSTVSASITEAVGTGTILDDDAVSVAIDDVTVTEGTDDFAVFTVTLTGNIQDALSVDYATSDVTALAGSDYTATNGTLTFVAGSTDGATLTISVPILDDAIAEPTETFLVTLSNVVFNGSASITEAVGTGTILDDDAVSVAIDDVTVTEGTDDFAVFTVTLTGNIQDALSVDYATSDVTALAGSDYTATNGTLTFVAGSTDGATLTISVPILDDAIAEPTETFLVTLSNVVFNGSASITEAVGTGTILDDDAVSVAIDDVTVTEGTDDFAVFTVTLTGNIQDALSVDYATSDVTALAGSDYTATNGTLTFVAGSTDGATLTISVPILDDAIAEPTETFLVTLSNVVFNGSASITEAVGTGTILDDDAVSVAIDDVTVTEGTDDFAVFTVTLTGNIQDALSVDYATSDVTALAGSDYTATNGTLTFVAGSTDGATLTISVPILDDAIAEPTETFLVTLSNVVFNGSASITEAVGTGTILDDDAVSVAIDDVTVTEGTDDFAVFTVTLTGNIQDALSVDYATSDVTALAGSDYTATNGTLTFVAGSTDGATLTISVPILDDAIAEPTETFLVTLSNVVFNGSASITEAVGTGTILDDDAVSVAIDDVTVTEGTDDFAVFTVTPYGQYPGCAERGTMPPAMSRPLPVQTTPPPTVR